MMSSEPKPTPEIEAPAEWLEGLNRAILDSALDCIITMDAEGLVREFNPAAERVFGYSRQQAVGQKLAELIIPPPLRDRHRQGLEHYLRTGEGPMLGRRIEIDAVRADGTEILVELAITAFRIAEKPAFTAYLRTLLSASEANAAAQRSMASPVSSPDRKHSPQLGRRSSRRLPRVEAGLAAQFGCAMTGRTDSNAP